MYLPVCRCYCGRCGILDTSSRTRDALTSAERMPFNDGARGHSPSKFFGVLIPSSGVPLLHADPNLWASLPFTMKNWTGQSVSWKATARYALFLEQSLVKSVENSDFWREDFFLKSHFKHGNSVNFSKFFKISFLTVILKIFLSFLKSNS